MTFDTAKLRETLAKMTPGPWEVDTECGEGEYGSGLDTHSGFRVSLIIGPDGLSLFDALNSTAIIIHEEYDEDGVYAWDETSACNAAGSVRKRACPGHHRTRPRASGGAPYQGERVMDTTRKSPAQIKLAKLDARIAELQSRRMSVIAERGKELGFQPCDDCRDGFCTMNCSSTPMIMKVAFP